MRPTTNPLDCGPRKFLAAAEHDEIGAKFAAEVPEIAPRRQLGGGIDDHRHAMTMRNLDRRFQRREPRRKVFPGDEEDGGG